MFVRGDFALLQSLRLTWDSVTYNWNQWVLGYTPERQRRLLSHIGFSEATWQSLAIVLVIFAGIAVLVGATFALRDLRSASADAVKAAYDRFCRKLARRGVRRGLAEGPGVFAQRAARQCPELAAAVAEITRLYIALRYGGESRPDALRTFRSRVRSFVSLKYQ